jgi:hypothetical protein
MTATTQLVPPQAESPELAAYYADTRLLWRNIATIILGNIGFAVCMTLVSPLILLRLRELGASNGMISTMQAANGFVVAFLVLYFSWRSDHTVSRFGRRLPYMWISAPFIVTAVVLFPFLHHMWSLLILWAVLMLFMDMYASTFPLLMYDCTRRCVLARVQSINNIILAGASFAALQWGMGLRDIGSWMPYVLGAVAMLVCNVATGLIVREPPIRNPATSGFKPWSTFQVGLPDRRFLWLMAGITLIAAMSVLYNQWIWIFAKERLLLDETLIAKAMSWGSLLPVILALPFGYLVDRFGSLPMLTLFWIGSLAVFAALLWLTGLAGSSSAITQHGMTMTAIVFTVTGCMYFAADIMLVKSSPAADLGSVTACNSFIRNMTHQVVIMGSSGWILKWTDDNYGLVFGIGAVLCTVGYACFLIFRWVMRRG